MVEVLPSAVQNTQIFVSGDEKRTELFRKINL
jgi:hypothetical protein